ncbi:MAG: hypothetical protein ACYS6W_08675 [Planctomycetota bacterium]|jgi:hypothetical protein
MASLGAEEFILYDTMPGPVNPNMSKPVNGFDSTHSNNVSTAVYRPGTKIMSFQDVTVTTAGSRTANIGGYTCVYAKYVCGTTAIDVTAGEIMTQYDGSAGVIPFAVTRDLSGSNGAGQNSPCAIACADITPNAFGWYWCEGVCPQEDVTALDQSTFVTDGSVAQGEALWITTGASHATLSGTDVAVSELIVGRAYRTDA